ncbi:aminotransferase class I/II-fold pyridoxal phosphate-dependent enzyme [Georgenia sp. SYP-B2076]|uniref:aminotransferase class I/II-fold pyridoxal phosphate-dependent enzyme n=1 Tax=Georgenia sp. SYP-B2076 TaxID=2495881 RepID=UPI000F8C9ED4|nr:aminotransferase class I/II-fold pyridoxal phosphate-dependent enzyme [Georgenia sp. SYP-B2076]
MLDLTSASFLGFRHASAELGGWDRLTTGRPAALDEPPAAAAVAGRVARTQGAAAGVVHRSTLHALGDVIELERPDAVVVDAAAYPFAELAAARVLLGGRGQLATFAHHDAADARRVVARSGGRVLLLTDGWCGGCNHPAPLLELEALARRCGGVLLVDDTQALGVLGHRGAGGPPFGRGGGGTFAWLGGRPGAAVLVASLAKAYGAPLAVTSGPGGTVARLRTIGTRVHASPPSAVDLLAARAATGDPGGNERRRARLGRLVLAVRAALRRLRLPVLGLPFPVVHTRGPTPESTRRLHARLLAQGVRALLLAPRCLPAVTLSLALRADLDPRAAEEVAAALAAATGR